MCSSPGRKPNSSSKQRLQRCRSPTRRARARSRRWLGRDSACDAGRAAERHRRRCRYKRSCARGRAMRTPQHIGPRHRAWSCVKAIGLRAWTTHHSISSFQIRPYIRTHDIDRLEPEVAQAMSRVWRWMAALTASTAYRAIIPGVAATVEARAAISPLKLGQGQAEALGRLADDAGFTTDVAKRDLGGVPRVIGGTSGIVGALKNPLDQSDGGITLDTGIDSQTMSEGLDRLTVSEWRPRPRSAAAAPSARGQVTNAANDAARTARAMNGLFDVNATMPICAGRSRVAL